VKVVGLTGGIATGKSTVATILRRLGAKIIDADDLSRETVQPGQTAWNENRRTNAPAPQCVLKFLLKVRLA